MWESMTWLAIFLAIAGLGAFALYLARGGAPSNLSAGFFKPKIEPRIGVVAYAAMDSKRRLVLIRRDDVEHLVMTGGPVDMVIETGIGGEKREADAHIASAAPATAHGSPRGFGQRGPEPSFGQPPPLFRPLPTQRSDEPELPASELTRVERG